MFCLIWSEKIAFGITEGGEKQTRPERLSLPNVDSLSLIFLQELSNWSVCFGFFFPVVWNQTLPTNEIPYLSYGIWEFTQMKSIIFEYVNSLSICLLPITLLSVTDSDCRFLFSPIDGIVLMVSFTLTGEEVVSVCWETGLCHISNA